LAVLDARAELNRARVSRKKTGTIEVQLSAARQRLSESPLELLTTGLTLTGKRLSPFDAIVQLEATRDDIPEAAPRGEPSDHVHVWWSVDSDDLPDGTLALEVHPPSGALQDEGHAVVEFEVIAVEGASGSERCRADYVTARLALDAGDYELAAERARESAAVGERVEYYRMAALHVLGNASAALGNDVEALDAYRLVLEIANEAFPKSRLPALLGPVIRRLEAATGQ
jgi:hypothetical protein